LADSLDMLADATAYAIALTAIRRSAAFRVRAAGLSGGLLLVLGIGVLIDVGRRALYGSSPEGAVMVAVASAALVVNATVLRLLARTREGGVHLKATWIFTRADVIANFGVIASGLVVWLTGNRYVDLIIGGAIGAYVIKEAFEILGEAREASSTGVATRG
jgi:Co/Zn/Cd efflux system component